MEEKEQPLSIVIGYNKRTRHESINLPKYTFLRHWYCFISYVHCMPQILRLQWIKSLYIFTNCRFTAFLFTVGLFFFLLIYVVVVHNDKINNHKKLFLSMCLFFFNFFDNVWFVNESLRVGSFQWIRWTGSQTRNTSLTNRTERFIHEFSSRSNKLCELSENYVLLKRRW